MHVTVNLGMIIFPLFMRWTAKWKSELPTNLPIAQVLRFESRTKLDAFTPMGIIATIYETDSLLQQYPETPILFPEDRAFPIRLTDRLPIRW